MWFLIKAALLLVVVLALIPTGSDTGNRSESIRAGDAMSAAQAAIEDARGFCTRQPEACQFAGRIASSLGEKAQAGAKLLYEFLRDNAADSAAPATTGSVSEAAGAGGDSRALAPGERGVPWHGPEAPARRHD